MNKSFIKILCHFQLTVSTMTMSNLASQSHSQFTNVRISICIPPMMMYMMYTVIKNSNISCHNDKEINDDLHNNQVISTDVNMSSTDQVAIFNEVNNEENEYQNDAQEEVVIEVEESNPSTDVCHQNLVVNVVKGIEFTTSIQFNQLNMKDEEIDNFLSSMVS